MVACFLGVFYRFNRDRQDDIRCKINVNGLGNFASSPEKRSIPSGTDSLPGKAKTAEAAWQMKVQFVDRGPGAPVGMGRVVATLVEIGAPLAAFINSDRADVGFEQGGRYEEFDTPGGFIGRFRLDHLRHSVENASAAGVCFRFRKAIIDSGGTYLKQQVLVGPSKYYVKIICGLSDFILPYILAFKIK